MTVSYLKVFIVRTAVLFFCKEPLFYDMYKCTMTSALVTTRGIITLLLDWINLFNLLLVRYQHHRSIFQGRWARHCVHDQARVLQRKELLPTTRTSEVHITALPLAYNIFTSLRFPKLSFEQGAYFPFFARSCTLWYCARSRRQARVRQNPFASSEIEYNLARSRNI